ncbi:MAG: DUF402 domain-containing protein [Lachnospiraceae bacterium]|nr:DUF402 domain-containing protein [Lachnospiraceae bacterium]
MPNLKLFRKRIIPNECVLLKDDIILSANEEFIITKWNTLKPKKDLHHGYSCFFLKEGFKISKFYREDNSLMCWYCDIVDYDYNEEEHSLTATDLLADVIIEPDGFVRVVDLDELADILEQHNLSEQLIVLSLRRLNHLLGLIYAGEFDNLKANIEKWEA